MTALRLRWLLLAVCLFAGCAFGALYAHRPLDASLSYLGGLILAVGTLEFGVFIVRSAARLAPSLALIVAMLNYATSVIAFVVVLKVSSPRVVDGLAVASGLLLGSLVWAGTEVAVSWVRRGTEEWPVNISSQDGTSSGVRE